MTTDTADRPTRRGRPGYDRADVLRAAVELFIEQGYDATSVADVARRLGLAKSALYHHFDSKEELLAIALDTALGGLESVLAEPGAKEGPAIDRLRHVVRGAVEILADNLPEVTLLLRVRGNSSTEIAALERRRVFDQRVTEIVTDAQAQGDIRADIAPPCDAPHLRHGQLPRRKRPAGTAERDQLAREVLTVALDGVRTPTS